VVGERREESLPFFFWFTEGWWWGGEDETLHPRAHTLRPFPVDAATGTASEDAVRSIAIVLYELSHKGSAANLSSSKLQNCPLCFFFQKRETSAASLSLRLSLSCSESGSTGFAPSSVL
jgi:hypothetical protein